MAEVNGHYRSGVKEEHFHGDVDFIKAVKKTTKKAIKTRNNQKSLIYNSRNFPQQGTGKFDFLGANRFGKTSLVGSFGKGRVPVESLRGKTIALYFASLNILSDCVPSCLIDFYNTLKKQYPSSFEMIFVMIPNETDIRLCSSCFNEIIISRVPCPIVRLVDYEWRSYLCKSYGLGRTIRPSITFIDTKQHDSVNVLSKDLLHYIKRFGPLCYPFTRDRGKQLASQGEKLRNNTSIKDILGSETRDYLINNHRFNNKVPISGLQNKDVLLYAYSYNSGGDLSFMQKLGEIYNQYWKESFEIVSINLDHNGGPQDEKSFSDHLAGIPWLSLPFGDDKIWILRDMILLHPSVGFYKTHPILFIKPKGESLLDPYGFQVFKIFGKQAFPFTRHAAAHTLMNRQKRSSFRSFVRKAAQLGFDFNSLIRKNKTTGKAEDVSLSTIMQKTAKGILLLFASPDTCSRGRLNSLIAAYNNQKESNSYEVIFVSTDEDTQPFGGHFFAMPWFAFPKPLTEKDHMNLTEATIEINCCTDSHFLAYGPDGLLLKVGFLAKSFENCDFPFINDDEWADHLAYALRGTYGWGWCGDGFYTGDGWWSGLEDFSVRYLEESS